MKWPFYAIMPEYPMLYTVMNGILINFPSPGGLRLVEPTPRRGGDEGEGEEIVLN